MTKDEQESWISVRYLLLKVVFNEVKKITVPTALVSKCSTFGDLGGTNLGCPSEKSQVSGYSFVINDNGFVEDGFFLISLYLIKY